MAAKQMANDSFSSNLAGMSKKQLYDIMSQMKELIEQNQQQSREILVDNPALTKALFQAQIMLGMVKPPQAMPPIQQAQSQPPQQAVQPVQPPSIQAQPLPVQVVSQDQTSAVQSQIPARKQQPSQPVSTISSALVPTVTHQPQPISSHSIQSMQPAKGHMGTEGTSMPLQQSVQVHNRPPPQLHSAQQPPSFHHSQVTNQPQQSLHSSGPQHHHLQPPLPPQPRPPSMQPFQHPHQHQHQPQHQHQQQQQQQQQQHQQQQQQQQQHQHMGPHAGFQAPGLSQPHFSQPTFNAGNRHPGSIGFPQGQSPLPNQLPPQSVYQVGGSHSGPDFNNQGAGPMQLDRSSWMPGPPENLTGGAQLPCPPLLPGQMGPTSQPPPPPQLTHEMQKALLQQVMSLTPEQINFLPPEQRHQVLQLQQMMG